MKRILRRTAAIVTGLILGWIAASYTPLPSLIGPALYAQGTGGTSASASGSEPAGRRQLAQTSVPPKPQVPAVAPDLPAEVNELGHGGARAASGVHLDAGQAAAANLLPLDANGKPAVPQWFHCVVWGIVGLFVAALIVGIPMTRLRQNSEAQKSTGASDGH